MTINPTYNVSVEIQGGIGVTATIKNIGDTTITNVQWTFTLTSGLILLGKTKSGTSLSLEPNTIVIIKDKPLLGFGKTTIKVDVTCAEGASMTQTKTGTIFLFFVLELQ
jgi:uncharacterized repeat protein (TIGR01451 family)